MIPTAKWNRDPADSQPMTLVSSGADAPGSAEYARMDLGNSMRLAMMLTPVGRGPFSEQMHEVLDLLLTALARQAHPMTVTLQTVFLRHAADQAECERLLAGFYGAAAPVTNFVLQPPCSGAALALEAWAIGGVGVRLERFGAEALAVSYDQIRWVYCGGIRPGAALGAYEQTIDALFRLRTVLARAGSGFEHVVRTWFHVGGITGEDAAPRGPESQRYQQFNRARTDYYRDVQFCCSLPQPSIPHGIYPASTGIGMEGSGLVVSCMAVQTSRPDVFILPLENPQQTPAYAYHPRYSSQSPKFSRGVALVIGDYVTTWISGTASILHSESCHPGRLDLQVEQTLDNIERLIAPENFTFHGVTGAGARLADLAKIRVYLKRAEDYPQCRAICEKRLGAVPAIYAGADICRPELLVEIEGVAFSKYSPQPRAASAVRG